MSYSAPKPNPMDTVKNYLPFAAIAVVLIVGIILAVVFLGGKSKKKDDKKSSPSTPESVAEAFMIANYEGDLKEQFSYTVLSAEEYLECAADEAGCDTDEYLDEYGFDSLEELLEESGEEQREDCEDKCGQGYTCSAKAEDVTTLEGNDFDDVIEELERYKGFIDLDSIEEACKVKGTVTITCDGEEVDEERGTVILVKIDGKWKVAH